jgi:hypothetical protein
VGNPLPSHPDERRQAAVRGGCPLVDQLVSYGSK